MQTTTSWRRYLYLCIGLLTSKYGNLLPASRSGSSSDLMVVYHYTTRMGMADIVFEAHKEAELFACLEERLSHFGQGIYGSCKDPEAFGSK